MKKLFCCAAVLAFASSLQAQGLIVAAMDDGLVTVFDKSNPKQAILTFRPFATRGGVFVAAGEVTGSGGDDILIGGTTTFQVFTVDGRLSSAIQPYGPSFAGGVRVAVGDVNGDGRLDIITGTGAGAPGGHVKVFDGVTGQPLYSFLAFDSSFTGGIFVAAGDVDGDGRADIIVGAGPGGGSHVKVFSGQNLDVLQSFLAFGAGFTGGVRVATGDVNGDGRSDIITGAGAGGAPAVKVFDGRNASTVLASFLGFDPSFTGGVYVAGDPVIFTPGAPSGDIATIRIVKSDGTIQWLMPFPSYVGGLTVGASPGAMSATPARPRIPGPK